MNTLLQTLWEVCDCLSDDLSTITACEAFIIAADSLAVHKLTEWKDSPDYQLAKKTVDE